MAIQKPKNLCFRLQSQLNFRSIINNLSYKPFKGLVQYFTCRFYTFNSSGIHKRGTILQGICQAMIAVICAQSFKFVGAPEISYYLYLNGDFINIEPISINVSFLHIVNMMLHVLLFSIVLVLLKKNRVELAKFLLLSGFCSYIFVACLLWQYNLNLQYYFLLSMFVSCYIFDKHEKRNLIIAICIQISLFVGLHHSLPSLYGLSTLILPTIAYDYLRSVLQINTYVFVTSCVICALFIRKILATNWHTLTQYEATQRALLKKLFPAQLMPSLLLAQSEQLFNQNISSHMHNELSNKANYEMQTTQQMGVVFLDICQFTQLSTNKTNDNFSWQAIYHLFAKYDLVINQLDAKRIKTNGDQYILLVGLASDKNTDDDTAMHTILACKQLLSASNVKVKIGAAFGTVTFGVFDPNNPNFDIWGETVIRAARLEALAKPNSIIIDSHLHTLTKNHIAYAPPSLRNLKGLGKQFVYEVQA